jgi:hypothetical protein
MKVKLGICLLILHLILFGAGYSADIIFVNGSADSSEALKQVKLACRFYGLDLEILSLSSGHAGKSVVEFLINRQPRALVIAASALSTPHPTFTALHQKLPNTIPWLIMPINAVTDSLTLIKWSGGAIRDCRIIPQSSFRGFYRFGKIREVAQQLSGQTVSFASEGKVFHLQLAADAVLDTLLEITGPIDGGRFPVFVKTFVNKRELFFQSDFPPFRLPPKIMVNEEIFELLPLLIFLRYAAGEYAWHSVGHYANFTIDDPWLTEPYGPVSYSGLLAEMEKVKFHTTIAFIPWNFDRSQLEVVNLFREHPDKFSICIHGNNHDHREFGLVDGASNSLAEQEADIQQALARMEKFRERTGLSYDRVMVFPHGIAPAQILSLLKKYNFAATANGSNIPVDSESSTDPLFNFRGVTLDFENFPSVLRFWPERTEFEIALNLFLDNPLLFYTHQDFFANGIDAFNGTAKMVNALQPDISWHNLGEIARYFYLQKLRADGGYDVLAFSSDFTLENLHSQTVTYYVQKPESFNFPIRHVTMDGQTLAYQKENGFLNFQITIPADASRHIVIEYENDLDLSAIDVSKRDLRVTLLRRLSDFRDITLSNYALGRAFTRFYYQYGLFKLGLVWLIFLIISGGAIGGWYWRRKVRKRRLQRNTSTLQQR